MRATFSKFACTGTTTHAADEEDGVKTLFRELLLLPLGNRLGFSLDGRWRVYREAPCTS